MIQQLNSKRYMHQYVHSTTVTIAKIYKQLKCPLTDEWINKCGLYIQWSIIQS